MRIEPDSKRQIAKKLRELREEHGYTQSDIGRLLGRAYTTVASWESAKGQPDADTLLRLLSLYGVENVLEQFGYGERHETLSPEERAHIVLLRALSSDARALVLQMAEGLSRLQPPAQAPLQAVARGNGRPCSFSLADGRLIDSLPDEGWKGEKP
jgi:transcriptional regulator with XRE-family HTH domain